MKLLSGIAAAWMFLAPVLFAQVAAGAEPPAPSRYEQPKSRTATVYAAGSDRKRILYKYQRTVSQSGSILTVVREFNYPDGKLAARETIEYENDNLVSYGLEELQINARGIAKVQPPSKIKPKGEISFTYITGTGSTAKTNTNTEKLAPDTIVADMMAPFLAAHWNELMKGKTIKCRFIAATRAETVGFEFVKASESTQDGKPVVVIKMSPSSFIIAALVDPLYFVIEKDGEHRTLQYNGRTTPKIRDGNKWKDLDAETVFDWD